MSHRCPYESSVSVYNYDHSEYWYLCAHAEHVFYVCIRMVCICDAVFFFDSSLFIYLYIYIYIYIYIFGGGSFRVLTCSCASPMVCLIPSLSCKVPAAAKAWFGDSDCGTCQPCSARCNSECRRRNLSRVRACACV